MYRTRYQNKKRKLKQHATTIKRDLFENTPKVEKINNFSFINSNLSPLHFSDAKELKQEKGRDRVDSISKNICLDKLINKSLSSECLSYRTRLVG